MPIISQLTILFGITLIGEIISTSCELPIPGSIIGMIILLVLLMSKKLKLGQIEEVGQFLLTYMVFLFIPAGVSLIESLTYIEGKVGAILTVCLLSTIITMLVTGAVAQVIIRFQEKREEK